VSSTTKARGCILVKENLRPVRASCLLALLEKRLYGTLFLSKNIWGVRPYVRPVGKLREHPKMVWGHLTYRRKVSILELEICGLLKVWIGLRTTGVWKGQNRLSHSNFRTLHFRTTGLNLFGMGRGRGSRSLSVLSGNKPRWRWSSSHSWSTGRGHARMRDETRRLHRWKTGARWKGRQRETRATKDISQKLQSFNGSKCTLLLAFQVEMVREIHAVLLLEEVLEGSL
jgi:hypothetical protein